MKNKTLNLVKEYKQGCLYDLGTGNDFLSHKKAKITKSKRCDYTKMKDLCARKNIYKVKT